MPTDADFLAALIAEPASDGPRLIYADWLDESGDEARAEFIRVQCALARSHDRDESNLALAERESQLLSRHQAAWREPLDRALFPDGELEPLSVARTISEMAGAILSFERFNLAAEFVRRLLLQRWVFRRGFAEKLCTVVSAYVPAAERVHRLTPIRSLQLGVAEGGDLAALAGCPSLARLESLRLIGRGNSQQQFDRLIESPHLANLAKFAIVDIPLAHFDMNLFSQSPLFAHLQELVLSDSGGGRATPQSLIGAPALARLKRLALRSFSSDVDWSEALASWPTCETLEELDLSGNALGAIDMADWLGRLPALRDLKLRDCRLSDSGLRSILRSPRLRQLKRLELSRNLISDAGAIDLADAPNLLAPTRVTLDNNPICERVREALRIRLGDQVYL